MSDRELLKLAAKAAGLIIHPTIEGKNCLALVDANGYWGTEHIYWNPLTDDGDALRLIVKLRIPVRYTRKFSDGEEEPLSLAEIRKAIVRAAAEIGKAMP